MPLPWWTSKSTIATRARPAARACAAATAMLLNRQKPIARSASAWWPGGRTQAIAGPAAASARTASTAATAAPAARRATSNDSGLVLVSGSSITARPAVAAIAATYSAVWMRVSATGSASGGSSTVAPRWPQRAATRDSTSARSGRSGCPGGVR